MSHIHLGHDLQHLQQRRHGIRPVVALEAAQVLERPPTLETLQRGNRPKRFGVDKLLHA